MLHVYSMRACNCSKGGSLVPRLSRALLESLIVTFSHDI